MKVGLIHIKSGSGNDRFFDRLELGLSEHGNIECQRGELPGFCEQQTFRISREFHRLPIEPGCDVYISQLEVVKQLRPLLKAPIIGIAHHRPGDPRLTEYLNPLKRFYYKYWLDYQFKQGLQFADHVVCISNFTEKSLGAAGMPKIPSTKISTIHNGIETSKYVPDEKSKQTPVKLLFIGNHSPRKGFDLLPELMRQLGSEFSLSYSSGMRPKGSTAFNLQNTKPLGFLDESSLIREYQKADLLLFPSRFEGFGYSAVEAIACGTPVIGFAEGTLEEILPEENRQFLARFNDLNNLIEQIKRISTHRFDPDQLHQHVEENFSLQEMAKSYRKLLEQVLSQN